MAPKKGQIAGQLEVLQTLVHDFCRARDWDQFHGPKDLAIGLVTEASELLEVFRFQSGQQCLEIVESTAGRKSVSDEMADVFFFLLRMAERFDIDLESALREKMKRNGERYPVDEFRGRNHKAAPQK